MIFLDTNIFMYAAGKEHPNKEGSVKLLEMAAVGEIEAATSVEVVQEILHRYTHIGKKKEGLELAKSVPKMIPIIFEVEYADIKKAMELLGKYEITSRDAIHAAVAINNFIPVICTYDSHFSVIEEISAKKPEELMKGVHSL